MARRNRSACSNWCSAALPMAGLADSLRLTWRSRRRVGQRGVQAGVHERPGPHVLGLLLQPDHLFGLCVAVEHGRQLRRSATGRAARPGRWPPRPPPRHRRPPARWRRCSASWAIFPLHRTMRRTVAGSATSGSSSTWANDPASSSSIGEREAVGPQHRLGRHHDQGALRACSRACERSRWKYWADVEGMATRMLPAGAEREEPLEAGGRVLGPLPLVAVREQHDQPGVLAPLDFGRGQEVVDDDLRPVGEVAELGLPGHQGLGRLDRVAVLEPDGGVLREERVAHGEDARAALASGPAPPCRPGPCPSPRWASGMNSSAVGVVHQHGVALAEGAAAGVLPGQADVDALVEQRSDGQRLGQGPVDLALGHHLVALGELALELGVDGEPVGHGAHQGGQRAQHVAGDAGLLGRDVGVSRGRARGGASAPARARPAPRRARTAAGC